MGSSPRSTCVGSRYGRGGSFPGPFSRALGLGRTALTGGHSPLRPVLAVTALPGLRVVSWGDCPSRPTPRRRSPGLRCRTYPRGTGILTRFPFGGSELRPALGPANPQPTTVAEEPWSFRPRGFSPLFAVTTAGIRTRGGSTGPHGPASAPPRRPPTGSRPHSGRAPGSRRPA